ncbi:hypothetical protein F5050DRAFT_262572 [Lentinula boryana]|uniref:Uncharacterized protein n=1 Tax=Lentinula boryana TaxID=40481 RepID=A0ABQ8QAQ0_9AGAR|nr:hypothetical protein F5050DRAFT_262572 [Lentinula boryana]
MLLSPSTSSPGTAPRISQILPTVKCSNCNQPVPLSELGDHICSVAPPVPPLPSNNGGGFKGRLQGLLSIPATNPPSNPIPSPPTSPSPKSPISPNKEQSLSTAQSSAPQPRRPSFANSRAGSTSFQSRSSPLARSSPEEFTDDYFSQKGNSPNIVSSNSGPGNSPLRERPGSHRHGIPSVSSIRSAANSVMSSSSARSGLSGGRDASRDTMNSMFTGSRNRDTVSSVNTARPSFISSSSSAGSPIVRGAAPLLASPFSAQKSTSPQPPISPRTPEPTTTSALSHLSVLSNASTTSNMMASMASSSSSPYTLSGKPLRPSFSPSTSMPGINRNMTGAPINRGVPVPNTPMSPRILPNNLQSISGRGPFSPGPSSIIGPPRTAYSPAPSLNGPPPSPPLPFPGSRLHSMSPSIHQPEPDTKIGGEAGMAGVGRRGFAAAARAALFTSNMAVHGGEGMPGGPFLDIAAAVRTTSTPPLTTNTLSPQSPGPVSPLTPLSTSPTSVHSLQGSALDKGLGAESSFFDKFRDRIPGLGLGSESLSPTDDLPTARTAGIATPRAGPSRQNSDASEASTSSAFTLNLAYSTSNASAKSKSPRRRTRKSSTNLPGVVEDGDSSGSEYGLAYADSTDFEDEEEHDVSRLSVRSGASKRTTRESRDVVTPKPGPRTDSLIKSRQRPVSGSLYSDEEDDDDDLRNRLQLQSSPPAKSNLSRAKSNASISSVSSASSAPSAATIAKALGLSRTSVEQDPEGYSTGRLVMGGPGVPGIARTPSGSRIINRAQRNRSATVSSARSFRSDGIGRARSGTEGSMTGSNSLNPHRARVAPNWRIGAIRSVSRHHIL